MLIRASTRLNDRRCCDVPPLTQQVADVKLIKGKFDIIKMNTKAYKFSDSTPVNRVDHPDKGRTRIRPVEGSTLTGFGQVVVKTCTTG